MEYIAGILGTIFIATAAIGIYICRPVDSNDDDNEDESAGMCLAGDLIDISSDLGNALEDYIVDRCADRAKYFNRRTADMSDFNSVYFEIGFDNPLICELLKRLKANQGKNV
jgi:hypothetical protein